MTTGKVTKISGEENEFYNSKFLILEVHHIWHASDWTIFHGAHVRFTNLYIRREGEIFQLMKTNTKINNLFTESLSRHINKFIPNIDGGIYSRK